ncbi:TRAP transporter small permease subunit [Consotaella aegiceratis]|uniref:TRAP transporter small permease subunit n=1 Tax=Consotaella aegiceratis TaxID=3097961 RepID=UPI002F3E87E6
MLFRTISLHILKALMVASLTLMCGLVFLNVVLRYGFNSNILLTEEVARYLFVWLTFLGSITAFARRRHVQVTMVVEALPPRWTRLVTMLGELAMLACCAMVLKGCWEFAELNRYNCLPVSGIPVGALYLAGIPFALGVGVMLLARLWNGVRHLAAGDPS